MEEKCPREAGGARGSTCCWPLKWAGGLSPLSGPVCHGHPTESPTCWLASGAMGKCLGCSQCSDLSFNGTSVLVLYGNTFYCHVSKQEDSQPIFSFHFIPLFIVSCPQTRQINSQTVCNFPMLYVKNGFERRLCYPDSSEMSKSFFPHWEKATCLHPHSQPFLQLQMAQLHCSFVLKTGYTEALLFPKVA